VSSAENGGDAGDSDDDNDDDNVVGFFLGTNIVRLEWCRAKTKVEKRAQRRGRKMQ